MRAAVLTLPCIAACLSACVTTYTPALLRAEGRQVQFTASGEPAIAAGCVARSIENARNVWVGEVRPLEAGAHEVVVRSPAAPAAGVFMLFHVKPGARGSAITGWFKQGFDAAAGEDFVRKAIKDC